MEFQTRCGNIGKKRNGYMVIRYMYVIGHERRRSRKKGRPNSTHCQERR